MAQGAGQVIIPEINQQLQRHLEETNAVLAASITFFKLPSNERRVSFAYDLLQEANLLPNLTIDGKSNKKSEEFRQKGNEKFKQRKAQECHEFYTKSVAHAESGSENLALAYANRSAILFDVGLYKQCLQDLEKALQHNYPENLKPKLLARQSKAKALENTQRELDFNTPCPTIPEEDRNPLIQSASKSVMIEYSDSLGRQVVAARDIEPGEIIAVEKPFAKTLIGQFYTHCHHCLKLCYTLIPCTKCTQAMFCSETCLTEAYDQYHQFECSLLLTILKLDLDHRHLQLRVTLLARDRFNLDKYKVTKDDVYRSDRYDEIYNLVANTSSRSVTDLFNRAVHAAALFHLIKTRTSFFTSFDATVEHTFKELLLHHMQVGPCNFDAVNESNATLVDQEIGDGAYSFLSMFNHSCCPNVVSQSYGDTIILIALEPIKTGQQCFDNYGCHHAVMPRKDRQPKLKKQYLFHCSCTACTENYPLYEFLKDHQGSRDYKLSDEELCILQSGSDLVEAKKIFEKLLYRIKAVASMKPDKTLSELQEAVKQCYSIFTMIKTPF